MAITDEDLFAGMSLGPAEFPEELRRDRYGRAYQFRDGEWVRDPEWDNGERCDVGFESHPITRGLRAPVPHSISRDEQLQAQTVLLRGARLKSGLSQEQVAALCGVSQPAWSLYERGRRLAPEGFGQRVAKELLNVEVPLRARRGRPPRGVCDHAHLPTGDTCKTCGFVAAPFPEDTDPNYVDWLTEEARANGVTEERDNGVEP